MLTLPPLFMSVWIERTWIGLRFFRFLIWFNFPDIMVYLRVITNSSTIRLAQVQTYRMKNIPTYFKLSSSPFQLLSYIIGGLMWFAGLLFLLGSDNTILFSFTIQKIHSLFIVVIWVKCLITIMFQQHPRNWTFDVLLDGWEFSLTSFIFYMYLRFDRAKWENTFLGHRYQYIYDGLNQTFRYLDSIIFSSINKLCTTYLYWRWSLKKWSKPKAKFYHFVTNNK